MPKHSSIGLPHDSESEQLKQLLAHLNSPAFLVNESRQVILLNTRARRLLVNPELAQKLLPETKSWNSIWLRIRQGHAVSYFSRVDMTSLQERFNNRVDISLSLFIDDGHYYALCVLSVDVRISDKLPPSGLANFPEQNPNPVMRLFRDGQIVYANKASEPLIQIWHQQLNREMSSEGMTVLNDAVQKGETRYADFNINNTVFTVAFAPIAGSDFINVYALDTTEKRLAEEALETALSEVKKLRQHMHSDNSLGQDRLLTRSVANNMIGVSHQHRLLLKNITSVAGTDATVLISGETGTGKELIATALHAGSSRKDQPMIKVNCAALPSGLIESELFGHEKGAFTGALSRKIGRFEQAHGATLFLDEIGDLPLELQAKLLRVLQEGEIERVGGSRTITTDVRVIAATNRILPRLVSSGQFREDLYYRLNVFPVYSPPLRQRKSDIALLASHFLEKYSIITGKYFEPINRPVIARLEAYTWPGNVRELENIIERSVILSEGPNLHLDDTFDLGNPSELQAKPQTLKEVEEEMIRTALEDCEWVVEGKRGAAQKLGMAPSTLRERIKTYHLQKLSGTGDPAANNEDSYRFE